MSERQPIPRGQWERIVAFLTSGRTGNIVIHVSQGGVTRVDLVDVAHTKDLKDLAGPPGAVLK